MKEDFEMNAYLPLVGFLIVGFCIWIGILRLWTFYEERTPTEIQMRLYRTAKNLPRDVINIVFSCVIWSGLGALLLRVVLGLVGLEGWLPSTPWALPVVTFFVIAALFIFWDGPDRSEPLQPRGRGLGSSSQKPAPHRSTQEGSAQGVSRGRTIRSYKDIK